MCFRLRGNGIVVLHARVKATRFLHSSKVLATKYNGETVLKCEYVIL